MSLANLDKVNAVITYQKKETDPRLSSLQNSYGYTAFGPEVMIWVSAELGDRMFWVHLMGAGGAAFFASDYVLVRAISVDDLVKQVRLKLESGVQYLLHGLPFISDNMCSQGLVKWDPEFVSVRKRQLFGSLMVHMEAEEREPSIVKYGTKIFFVPFVESDPETDVGNLEFYRSFDISDEKTFSLVLTNETSPTDSAAKAVVDTVEKLKSLYNFGNEPLSILNAKSIRVEMTLNPGTKVKRVYSIVPEDKSKGADGAEESKGADGAEESKGAEDTSGKAKDPSKAPDDKAAKERVLNSYVACFTDAFKDKRANSKTDFVYVAPVPGDTNGDVMLKAVIKYLRADTKRTGSLILGLDERKLKRDKSASYKKLVEFRFTYLETIKKSVVGTI
jgi:hypothetical protein